MTAKLQRNMCTNDTNPAQNAGFVYYAFGHAQSLVLDNKNRSIIITA